MGARPSTGFGVAAAAGAFVALIGVLALLVPATASANYWTEHRVLNITHQGGEDEAPSATMYAFERSMNLGSDMLEVDVNVTQDDKLVIMHDGAVDRTTNGTGPVADYTMAELKKLDAGYWFSPLVGYPHDSANAPNGYPFRGVRTGEKKPPKGYAAADFRPLELKELMDRYPNVPINIEIKGGVPQTDEDYHHCAEVLANFLNDYGRTEGIMVVSFNSKATEYFHTLAPQINLAPGTSLAALYIINGQPLPEGYEAFQLPPTYNGVPIVTQSFVDQAHGDGYGVHVWTIDDEPLMNSLLDMGVDGIMSAQPMRLEHALCRRDEPRPPLPSSSGGEHCNPDASIVCNVKVENLSLQGNYANFELARLDTINSKCAGTVTLSVKGKVKKRVTGEFDFGWEGPLDCGPSRVAYQLELPRELANQLQAEGAASLKTLPYSAFARKRSVPLQPPSSSAAVC